MRFLPGMYYLRSKAAADAIQFTLTPNVPVMTSQKEETQVEAVKEYEKVERGVVDAMIACSITNKDECVSCGS
jgi:hypothetical protein